jgi:hypothetical protein
MAEVMSEGLKLGSHNLLILYNFQVLAATTNWIILDLKENKSISFRICAIVPASYSLPAK